MSTASRRNVELTDRLGYLLKHVAMRVASLNDEALRPLGLDSRELGVMVVLAERGPGSQQEAAERLQIDRTTMVALLDALEGKGLVSRHPHHLDRRRNVVELTAQGLVTLSEALQASDAAESMLLGRLSEANQQQLREALRTVLDGSI